MTALGEELQHGLEIVGVHVQDVFLSAVVEDELEREPALLAPCLLGSGSLDMRDLTHLEFAL